MMQQMKELHLCSCASEVPSFAESYLLLQMKEQEEI